MQTRFSPGRAWAAAAGGRVAILPTDAAPEDVVALHTALADDVPTGVLLAEAEHCGRPLAILDRDRLARRSGVPAQIDGRALPSVDGDDLVAEPVDGCEIRIGLLDSLDAAVFPLRDGVARVAGIVATLEPVSAETLAPEEVREIVSPAEEAVEESDGGDLAPQSAPEPPAAPSAAAPPATGIGGIIDSVPGFSRPVTAAPSVPVSTASAPASAPVAPEPVPASVPAAPPQAPASAPVTHDLGDHDGSTVRAEDARALVAKLRAEREQRMSAPPAVDGRTVLSSVCGAGHANPPEETRCLSCGQPITPGSLEQRPQPEVAIAAMPGGERVSLLDGAVFGRRPRARTTGQRPKLIVVESPQEDISRSHLEMRIDGWSVVAEDLGSTNGTMLLRAGQPSQRLRPDSPVILQLGDRLDLGEGVVIEVQAP